MIVLELRVATSSSRGAFDSLK